MSKNDEPSLVVRRFEDRDEAAVTALWRVQFPSDRPWHDPAEVVGRKRACQPEWFFVAQLGPSLVGTALGGYDGHRGWLYHLAVDPAHRRRGIGSALVRHVEAALGAAGCPKLNLQVLAANAGVVAFYERLGYRVEERISMGKPLTS